MIKRAKINKTIWRICLAYLAFIGLSFALSQFLPTHETVQIAKSMACYWTDALFVYVRCGPDVQAKEIKEFIYNFWLTLVYLPMFAATGHPIVIVMALSIYAPILAIIFLLWASRRASNQKR